MAQFLPNYHSQLTRYGTFNVPKPFGIPCIIAIGRDMFQNSEMIIIALLNNTIKAIYP